MKARAKILLSGVLWFVGIINAKSQQLNHPVAITQNNGTAAIVARAPDSRAWTDPALNHNKLLQQQTADGVYKLIGTFKVVGSSYLFGEHHKADMFATEAKAYNIYVSYNTYNQEIEFYSTSNPNQPLVREPGTVDSFFIHANPDLGINSKIKFIYGAALGLKDKCYFQEICNGERFVLYKRYKSELEYATDNLAQTDLRRFGLQVDYYYYDTKSKALKKIKPNSVNVIKEFKDIYDLSAEIKPDDFTINPETAFCKAFSLVNQSQKGF